MRTPEGVSPSVIGSHSVKVAAEPLREFYESYSETGDRFQRGRDSALEFI